LADCTGHSRDHHHDLLSVFAPFSFEIGMKIFNRHGGIVGLEKGKVFRGFDRADKLLFIPFDDLGNFALQLMPFPPGKEEHLHFVTVQRMICVCRGNKYIFGFILRDHIGLPGLFSYQRCRRAKS